MNTKKLDRVERKKAKRRARGKRCELFASFTDKEWDAYRKRDPKVWKGLKSFIKILRNPPEKKEAPKAEGEVKVPAASAAQPASEKAN